MPRHRHRRGTRRARMPPRRPSSRPRAGPGQVREAVGEARDGAAVAALLALPGVVEQCQGTADPEADWPLLQRAATQALEQLNRARRDEGAAMLAELTDLARQMAGLV